MEKVYDKNGRFIGYKDKDYWGNEAFYDAEGRKQGTYAKDYWGDEAYYDAEGRKQGTFHEDYYGNKAYYDKLGRKQGTYQKDFWGNQAFYDQEGRKVGSSVEANFNKMPPPPGGNIWQETLPETPNPSSSSASAQPANRPYKLNYSHSAVDTKNAPASASLTDAQTAVFAAAAAKALKQNGVAFDLHTTKQITEELVSRSGFLNMKRQVKQIKKDVPDKGAWLLQRFDEEDEKDGYEWEDEILYVLTESGKLLRRQTRDNVPVVPGKQHFRTVTPWEPYRSANWPTYLDIYLKKKNVPLSSYAFTEQAARPNESKQPIQVMQQVPAEKSKAPSPGTAKPTTPSITPKGEDTPSKVLDYYGMMEDRDKFKIIRRQADQGDKPAMIALGLCFITGRGIRADVNMGISQIRNAANRNEPFAQYLLGLMNERNWFGLGGDRLRLYKWYSSAAKLGDGIAKRRLAALIELGTLNGSAEEARKLRTSAGTEPPQRTKSRNAIEQLLYQNSEQHP